MRKNHQDYSDEFRLKVAREYLETELSISELMEKYNIRGSSCITNWTRKFGLRSEPGEKRKNKYRVSIMSKGKEKTRKEKELERKVKDLEKQLDYEKLRSEAFDTLIKIAEDKYKIAIRKKSGTKQ